MTTRRRVVEDQTPKKIQVAEILMADIEEGLYKPGQRLPTEVKLMEIHGVSKTTIADAMASCANAA
jgi:DNA-binding GntR family transcriptional regulator